MFVWAICASSSFGLQTFPTEQVLSTSHVNHLQVERTTSLDVFSSSLTTPTNTEPMRGFVRTALSTAAVLKSTFAIRARFWTWRGPSMLLCPFRCNRSNAYVVQFCLRVFKRTCVKGTSLVCRNEVRPARPDKTQNPMPTSPNFVQN